MDAKKPVRPRLQIDASPAVVNRAKALAYGRGMSLTDLVLSLLAKEDEELAKLIQEQRGTSTEK